MTEQDNILRLAREAGITFKPMVIEGEEYEYRHVACNDDIGGDEAGCIERFYALVKAEAVAETREAIASWIAPQRNDIPAMGIEFAAAIRAMAATPSREGEV